MAKNALGHITVEEATRTGVAGAVGVGATVTTGVSGNCAAANLDFGKCEKQRT